MADDVTVVSGSYSATIAADEVGGVKYQRAKMVWGPDGTVNDADVASGKPLPVQLRSSGGTELTGLATVASIEALDDTLALDATLDGIATALADGSQVAQLRSGAKGASAAALVTSTAAGDDHQALDVAIVSGGGTGGTASDFGSAFPVPGTAAGFSDGTNMVAARAIGSNPTSGLVGVVVRPIGFATPNGDSMVDDTLNGLGVVHLNNIKASEGDDIGVVGVVAHDAAVSTTKPILNGAQAAGTLSGLTLVASADLTNIMADLDGAQLIRPQSALGDIVTGNASNTDGTSTEVLAAGASGIKHYLGWVVLTNAHATTFAYVELKDGSTVKATIPVPPSAGAYIKFDPPIPGTAATAWNFDPSAAVTTLYCSMGAFKSKV
jgi:hypothetical protein